MSKKLKLFVLVSVILNIVLIGIVGGHIAHRFGNKHDDKMIHFIEQTSLSDTKKAAFKEKLQQGISARMDRGSGREEHEKAMAVLTAKTLDVDLLRMRLEQMLDKPHQQRKQMTTIIVELASELNQQERKALAEVLRRPPPRDDRPQRKRSK